MKHSQLKSNWLFHIISLRFTFSPNCSGKHPSVFRTHLFFFSEPWSILCLSSAAHGKRVVMSVLLWCLIMGLILRNFLNCWIHVSILLCAGGGREIIILLWDGWVPSPPPWPHFPSWDFEACQTLNPRSAWSQAKTFFLIRKIGETCLWV